MKWGLDINLSIKSKKLHWENIWGDLWRMESVLLVGNRNQSNILDVKYILNRNTLMGGYSMYLKKY